MQYFSLNEILDAIEQLAPEQKQLLLRFLVQRTSQHPGGERSE